MKFIKLLKPIKFLKIFLIALFSYVGVFGIATFVANCFGIQIQDTLIDGVFSAIKIESLASGLIEIAKTVVEYMKNRMEQEKYISERMNYGQGNTDYIRSSDYNHYDSGGDMPYQSNPEETSRGD